MKQIILIPLLLISTYIYSQDISQLRQELDSIISKQIENKLSSKANTTDLYKINKDLKNQIKTLTEKLNQKAENIKFESLNTSMLNKFATTDSIIKNSTLNIASQGENITNINKELQKQGINISSTNKGVEENNLFILLSLFFGLLLLIACIVIYKLASKNKTNISSTNNEIKDILKLDNDLKSLLEKETQLLEGNKGGNSEEETLKSVKMVADEITTMENNIYQMDPSTKGLNRIVRAIRNLRNNFKVMGYDIPILLGNEFNEGDIMEVIADMPDEKIEKGKRIITRIVSPRIDHKGKMIQRAKVELKSNL